MPKFNRRGFLQFLGAAAAAPLLPSLPVRAAGGAAGFSTSKALWAGIHANAGSVPRFVKVAQRMGLSNRAIEGVSARSVGVRIALAAQPRPLTRAVPHPVRVATRPDGGTAPREIARRFERLLSSDAEKATSPAQSDDRDQNHADPPRDPDEQT